MKWLLALLPLTLFAQPTHDVVIIGAGVTGTYTGWRLVDSGKSDVHIFEGSDRIGGSLYTTHLEGMPNVPVELGFSYFLSSQKKISALVKHLELPTKPYIEKEDNDFVYFRGKRLRLKDEKEFPYNLLANEKDKTAYELIEQTFVHIDPRLTFDNFAALKKHLRYKGLPLSDVSYQSFFLETLSTEAFQMLFDLDDFQLVADVSLETFISNYLANSKGQALFIPTGFDQLPKHLAKEFENKGGHLYLKHHLMSISYEGEREDFHYRLLFYQEDGSFKAVHTKHLILTISPAALKLLAQQSPALKNEALHDSLDQLAALPRTVLYLGYETAWWKELGIQGGASFTTLPIRKCLYGQTEEEMPNGEKGNRRSLICASQQNIYNDFWESFSESKEFANDLGEHAVWQAEKQLQIVHGLKEMPKAYTGTFFDWAEAPHFGASFYWKTGTNPHDLSEYFQHPFFGEPLYVIGADYSLFQGWTEGDLDSADQMLKNYFFIDPPSF